MMTSIPIVLASDDRYVPFVAVTVASICYSTNNSIRLYLLDDNISCFHKRVLNNFFKNFKNLEVQYIYVDSNNYFKDFNIYNNIPKSTYLRLLIPMLCPEKKVIYSDVDVIFFDDIREFYEQDLDYYALGAVYHSSFDEKKNMKCRIEKTLNLTEGQYYFYAGNLLIDGEHWRKEKISEKLIELAIKHKNRINFGDQDILNMYFDTKFKLLDNRFCLTSQDIEYFKRKDLATYLTLKKNCVVRHFESDRKPWLTNMFLKGVPLENFEDFWFFAGLTPFYNQLLLQYIGNLSNNDAQELINNIKKPTSDTLKFLRTKVTKDSIKVKL